MKFWLACPTILYLDKIDARYCNLTRPSVNLVKTILEKPAKTFTCVRFVFVLVEAQSRH